VSQVTHPEKAFLQLVGKRLLKFSREARSRGEKFHDLSGFSPLQCGARVKFWFEEKPGGYRPVVLLKAGTFEAGELKAIAEEILEGPAVLRTSSGDDLEYVRSTDA
jgi:hypothetical protein